MPESSNTSFIPKRNPTKSSHSSAPRIFIGTLIVQILFFAVLIAALGVFAYERKLNSDLSKEVLALNNVISSFSEEDMQKIINIDTRLAQTKDRLTHTVSIVSLFDAIEASTLESIQIKNLEIKRLDDTKLSIESEMIADSFDSVLFQRGVLKRDGKLVVTNITDMTLQNSSEEHDKLNESQTSTPEDVTLSFKAELTVDTNLIPHIPASTAQESVNQDNTQMMNNVSDGSNLLPANDTNQSTNQ